MQLPGTSYAPEHIEARLGYLMRWYLRRRTTSVAVAVVQHIEALLAHPDFEAHPEQRCVYRRLVWQWRCVVAVGTQFSFSAKEDATAFNDQGVVHQDLLVDR